MTAIHSEEFKRDAVRIALTSGLTRRQVASDLGMADNLPQPAVLVADGGYYSDKIREDIEISNALAMIPMRKNRRVRKVVDMTIYTLRNTVERCLNKLEEQPSIDNPLRQNRRKLPRFRRHRLHQALAPTFVNMT